MEIVKYLVERGANVQAETSSLDTALTYACANGHTMIADILLQCGAELVSVGRGGSVTYCYSVGLSWLVCVGEGV